MMRAFACVLLLAACGREIHHTVDAPPADMREPDGDIPNNGEPTATAVSLTITRLGQVVPEVIVVFQDASSAVIQTSRTDVMGRAWADVPAGGFVTAIEHTGAGVDELTTFSAVQPADALRLDLTPVVDAGVSTFTLTVPTDAAYDGYLVHTSCGSTGVDATGTGEVTLEGCGGSADLVVVPTVEGLPIAKALVAQAQALPATGALILAGTYDAFEPHTLSYSNVPAHVQSLVVSEVLTPARRAYEAATSDAPVSGSLTVELDLPVTASDLLTITTQYPTSGEAGQQSIFEWGPASSAYALDLGATMLPAFTAVGAFDPATHTLSWGERSASAQPDAVRAQLSVYRDDIPTGRAWKWRIVAPRDGASVVLPVLPTTPFDFNPHADDTVGVAELTTLKHTGGYAALRANAFAALSRFITGATGRMVVQMLYSEQL